MVFYIYGQGLLHNPTLSEMKRVNLLSNVKPQVAVYPK